MGVLLSTVLRHRGMSVPLQSKVDHIHLPHGRGLWKVLVEVVQA